MPIAASVGAPEEAARYDKPIAALRFRSLLALLARRITRLRLTGCRRAGTRSPLEGALPEQRRAARKSPRQT